MKQCYQTETQSVYEHGISVKNYLFNIINMLRTNQPKIGWKLPTWLFTYREQILNNLLSDDIIKEYTIFHDCGKPYCIEYDNDGRRHFNNHSEVSYSKWLEIGGSNTVATLMKMDMDIHTIKDKDVIEFCNRPQAITLLLTGLAEIYSNSEMFGGTESISFKIKYKQIDKRGKAICLNLFEKGK